MSTSHGEHAREQLDPPRVVEVADRVYAYVQPDGSWWINNAGFVTGSRYVLSIDTCSTEARTEAYLEALRSVAGDAPRVLVNTHHHGDHTNGNSLLPYATIVGQERCRELMMATGLFRPEGIWEPVEWGELTLAPPFVTFEDRLNLYVDDLLVELHHFETAAHTTNDVVAWIPERRVLFSGDLVFNGGTPFVLMGSVQGCLAVLARIAEFDAAVVVPGHGPPCGIESIDVVGEYLRFVQATAIAGRAAGQTPLEAARRADLGPFAGLTDPERLVGNLHRAYAECEGAMPGDPIDLAAALRDMVAFNGGAPLRCLA
ncbi:MAG TPA: MBL fold metallo-hydrolase [Acidimicrobiales bacterium]|nr:MBL fold metallo-hydrolase [Acidimicrobiales bacterium]